jgi:predicted amidohydrolase
MEKMRVHLIQSRVHWHDPADNRSMFETWIDSIEDRTDLIVLPETFASGFTQSPEKCAESMDGESVSWMREMAARSSAVITGSLAIAGAGVYRNRLIWMPPEGEPGWYDKHHLFRMAGEHLRYAAGKDRVIFHYKGWRVFPQICYDLRFPVWARTRNDYDLMLYVANWPKPRSLAWHHLLRARAIENQCYVLGVNRVGEDGNGWHYQGGSAVIDFLGQPLAELGDAEGVISAELDPETRQRFLSEFPFAEDADDFSLIQ